MINEIELKVLVSGLIISVDILFNTKITGINETATANLKGIIAVSFSFGIKNKMTIPVKGNNIKSGNAQFSNRKTLLNMINLSKNNGSDMVIQIDKLNKIIMDRIRMILRFPIIWSSLNINTDITINGKINDNNLLN